MQHLIKEIELEKNKSLNSFFDNKLSEINVINLSLPDAIEIDIRLFKISLKDEELYNHMLVSRAVAQMSLNLLKNPKYYVGNHFRNYNLIENISDANDRLVYGEHLQKLLNLNECSKEYLLHILKSNLFIYCIVCKLLRSMTSSHDSETAPQQSDSIRYDSSLYSTMSSDGDLSSYGKWQCSMCETINDGITNCCVGCEEKKPTKPKSKRKIRCHENLNGNKLELSEPDRKHIKTEQLMNNPREKFEEMEVDSVPETTNEWETLDLLQSSNLVQCRCRRDSYLNSNDADNCSVCGIRGPHNDKWICEQCTMINDKLDEKCSACEVLNPFIINKPDLSNDDGVPIEDKWCCSACTFLNCFGVAVCVVCNNQGPHYDKWRCEKCTFINDKCSETCGACDDNHPHIKNNIHSPQSSVPRSVWQTLSGFLY